MRDRSAALSSPSFARPLPSVGDQCGRSPRRASPWRRGGGPAGRGPGRASSSSRSPSGCPDPRTRRRHARPGPRTLRPARPPTGPTPAEAEALPDRRTPPPRAARTWTRPVASASTARPRRSVRTGWWPAPWTRRSSAGRFPAAAGGCVGRGATDEELDRAIFGFDVRLGRGPGRGDRRGRSHRARHDLTRVAAACTRKCSASGSTRRTGKASLPSAAARLSCAW